MRSRVPAILAFAGALLLAAVTGLLVLEGILLLEGANPITWYTRCAVSVFPGWAMFAGIVVAGGVGALIAHFFWDAGDR